jgi:predicted aconitase
MSRRVCALCCALDGHFPSCALYLDDERVPARNVVLWFALGLTLWALLVLAGWALCVLL